MPRIPFTEWLPDIGALSSKGVVVATNVLPAPDGFDPSPQFEKASDPVRERPLGARAVLDKSLVTYQYCGTDTGLFVNEGGIWVERTRYNTPGDDQSGFNSYESTTSGFWDFMQWGDQIIATNGFDVPQIATIGSQTGFADLNTGAWDFKARYVAIIRSYVVMAHLDDISDPEGDPQRPSRVKWSGFNNETQWTPDTSTLSDYEDLKQKKIVRIFGGEYGVIFQDRSIWKMTFIGAPVVFQFDEVQPDIGLIAPGAAVQVGDMIYFWSQKGFFALKSGSQMIPIGANKIDLFAATDLDQNYSFKISAAADPKSQKVHFLYPGPGNVGGEPNKRLVFDVATGNWSVVDESLSLIWHTAGVSIDLEVAASPGDPLDLDAAGAGDVSFDDPRWIGTAYSLAAFNSIWESGFFNGENLRGEIITAEYSFNPNGRASLQGVRPLVEGGTVTAQVGSRNSLGAAVDYSAVAPTSRDLTIYFRKNARYHRIRFYLEGDWDHAMGFEIEDRDLRMVEGRG